MPLEPRLISNWMEELTEQSNQEELDKVVVKQGTDESTKIDSSVLNVDEPGVALTVEVTGSYQFTEGNEPVYNIDSNFDPVTVSELPSNAVAIQGFVRVVTNNEDYVRITFYRDPSTTLTPFIFAEYPPFPYPTGYDRTVEGYVEFPCAGNQFFYAGNNNYTSATLTITGYKVQQGS